jgi:UPF0271 protein
MPAIDLNSDLGEGYGVYKAADDEEMLKVVTTCHVACGLHAGDPEIMARTFASAKAKGVAVGAHPGFPDLWGFGRRRMPFTADEIERLVAYQVGAAQALAAYAGTRVGHVKAHGMLGLLAADDTDVANAVAKAVKAVDRTLISFVIAGTEGEKAADRHGLRTCREIFADRAYTDKGTLVPRKEPNAMVEDPQAAGERIVQMLEDGAVIALSGKRVPVAIETICVHSDTRGSVAIATEVRRRLEAGGWTLTPFYG